MSNCATYWKALNQADEKLAALESMLSEATEPVDEIRNTREAAGAARDEYVRLCEEGFPLGDGRRVWGPDLLALKQLEHKNQIKLSDIASNIRRLDGMGRIIELALKNAAITTLVPIGRLKLEELSFGGNARLTTLEGLEEMTSLRRLYAIRCNMVTLAALSELALESLVVSGNERLKDLTGVEKMYNLRTCYAEGCGLMTLQALKGLRLDCILVDNNPGLTALGGLDGMTSLKTLSAKHCGLSCEQSAYWRKMYPFCHV